MKEEKETKPKNQITQIHEISVGDFSVSTTASLKDAEKTINKLIKKHKSFAKVRSLAREYRNILVE